MTAARGAGPLAGFRAAPGRGAASGIPRPASGVGRHAGLWVAASSLAGLAVGLGVSVFQGDGIERPTLVISTLFANVVGVTAMVCSVWLFPRLRGRSGLLRFPLLVLALLSGAVLGSLAVLGAYPLFIFREPRLAVGVVVLNSVLALVVGGVVLGYEEMRLRLQDALREMREVRLVEARLREEAARAELAALQARINPHFFFNTLNTIGALVEEDARTAEELLETFAHLFRYAFHAADAAPVALRDEIAFTRGYLRIEQARFGDRLRVAWDVAPDSLRVRVPGLILQPLVENAVGHGLAPRARGGRIEVSTALDNGALRIDVVDDGVGLSGARNAVTRDDHDLSGNGDDLGGNGGDLGGNGGDLGGNGDDLGGNGDDLIRDGHGLGNVAGRLRAAYGARAALALSAGSGGWGTRARITLPAAPAGPESAERAP